MIEELTVKVQDVWDAVSNYLFTRLDGLAEDAGVTSDVFLPIVNEIAGDDIYDAYREWVAESWDEEVTP